MKSNAEARGVELESGNESNGFTRRGVLLASAGVLAACRAPTGRTPAAPRAPAVHVGRGVDLERFVADCVAANDADGQAAVAEVLRRDVHDPSAMRAALGPPERAGLNVLLRSETLTIFAATWTPQMNLMPHDHLMWALIGIYAGREDNIFWRRSEEGVTAYGAECLFEGDVGVLPDTVIHSVTNPLERSTGGVHLYGGDFFATTRSQWDPETRAEEPSDGDVIRGIFERANERMDRMTGG